MKPTNKLRWLNVPAKMGAFEEVEEYAQRQGVSWQYALAITTKPATRTLQQWWGHPQGWEGEWRNIEEVEDR